MSTQSVRLTLCLGALLALQGCNLVIPSGLLAGVSATGTAAAKPVDKDAKPGQDDTTKPGMIDGRTVDPKGPPSDQRPPTTEPGLVPGNGGNMVMPGFVGKRMPYPMDCKSEFATLDADGSGALSGEEFVAWSAINSGCGPRDGGGIVAHTGGGTLAANGSGMVSSREGNLIAAGSGNIVAVGGETMVDGGAMIAPAPCGPGMGPHGEPKLLFLKADQNGDGQVDPGEFCTIQEALFGAPPPPENNCGDGFKRADQDGNGQVSLDEYLQADYHNPIMNNDSGMVAGPAVMPSKDTMVMRFKKYDLDQSGALDPKEWCYASGGPNVDPPVMPPPPRDERCDDDERDSNGDGLISWEEYFTKRSETIRMTEEGYARFKEQTYAEFQKRDINGDGSLDYAERNCTGGIKPPPADNGCGATFKGWDVDGDGKLTPQEYADGKWSEIRFIQAPTKEEEARMRESFYSEFKSRDRNGDARLSYDEFVATCQ